MSNARALTLNTGASMPLVGLGTWLAKPSEVGAAVHHALLKCGYKHVDCAWIYRNEKEIGEAFSELFGSGHLARDEIFITSKLWNSFHAKERVGAACKESLRDLRLEYLDLYLMHWGVATPPGNPEPMDENGVLIREGVSIRETWEAMQELVTDGLVKAIGVSNFTAPMLIDLFSYAAIMPAVNQIELHPYLQQVHLVEFCRQNDIVATGYSPLGRPGYPETSERILEEGSIKQIATAHGKTPAQVVLRWGIQRGTVVIPKSTHMDRIQENGDIFDFELSGDELERLAALERGKRFCNPEEWWKIPYFG